MKNHLLKNILAPIVALFVAFVALPQAAQAQTTEAYVVEDGATLTFYYDTNKATRTGTVYGINDTRTDSPNMPAWAGTDADKKENITKVVFDNSFKDYKPTSMKNWFYNCTKVNAIEGLSNLKTDKVTSMRYTFYKCSSLTSLDLSSFDTSNVTTMNGMFSSCSSLSSLDVSSFDTSNVTDMSNMFGMLIALTSLNVKSFNTANVTNMQSMFHYCLALTSLDLTNFNTSKVTNMGFMFKSCSSLSSLVLSNFDTSKVTDMAYMFYNCSNLTTIYCDDDWNSNVVSKSNYMFSGSTSLVGAVAYDESKVDVTMANPTTGYFTKKDGGVESLESEAVPAARRGIYNLQGIKMQGSFDQLPAGFYIVNGQKVFKK